MHETSVVIAIVINSRCHPPNFYLSLLLPPLQMSPLSHTGIDVGVGSNYICRNMRLTTGCERNLRKEHLRHPDLMRRLRLCFKNQLSLQPRPLQIAPSLLLLLALFVISPPPQTQAKTLLVIEDALALRVGSTTSDVHRLHVHGHWSDDEDAADADDDAAVSDPFVLSAIMAVIAVFGAGVRPKLARAPQFSFLQFFLKDAEIETQQSIFTPSGLSSARSAASIPPLIDRSPNCSQ